MIEMVDQGRPNWDEYFLEFARIAAQRSTCLRRQVGAILVRDRQILATGYNGAPKYIQHCSASGCLREELKVQSGTRHELCRGVHAEQNAIVQAAYQGLSTKGATLYTLLFPCSICTKLIINAGIREVVYLDLYPDDLTQKLILETPIHFRRMC